MAISINCSSCGKHYSAADHMAGRRVRCKDCGTTFQLPTDAVDASQPFKRPDEVAVAPPPAATLGGIDPLAPPSRAAAAAAAIVAKKAAAARPAPGAPDADPGDDRDDVGGIMPPEDVFDEAFQDFTPARGNTPFVFPGSHILDQWLPPVLVILSVAWLAYMVLDNGGREPGWVGVVRLLVLLMTYAGVMFPLCLMGVRMAARKLNYELPSGAPFRAFATFLLPVTIGCVVWLSSETPAGFIFGTAMGLIVALPIMWLLFRIRPDDAPVSLGYGAGAFGVAILSAVVLLAVLNLILVGVVRGAKSQHRLAQSPFGPGFAWDGATIKDPPPKRLVPPPSTGGAAVAEDDGEERPPGDGPPTGEVAEGGPPTGAAATTAPGTAPGEGAVAGGGESPEPAPPRPQPQAVVPAPGAVPAGGAPPAVPGDALDLTPEVATANAAVVGEVHERVGGNARQIVHPLLPGRAMVVIKEGAQPNEDHIELWDATGWAPMADVALARPADAVGEYAVSSDGSYLARIANFPYPAVQVHSFLKGRLLRPFIKLDPAGRQPRIVGFTGKDQIAILYENDDGAAIDVWDVNKVTRQRRVKLGGFRAEPGNHAFSRDGKHLALVVPNGKGGGRLEVYDITTGSAGRLVRKIEINEIQWGPAVKPTGVSFSGEGDRLAVLFENGGQGLFLCWDAQKSAPVHQHLFPGGLVAEGVQPHAFYGERFGLVDQGRAWILYGASVFDSASGKRLGDLGIKGVYAQKVAGPSTVLLAKYSREAGSGLVEVRLDLDRARRALEDAP